MQPLRLAADAKAGLVHVLDRRARYEVTERFDEIRKPPSESLAHPGDGRGDQLDAEQIGHQLGQAILGQQLIMQQIGNERGDPLAVLHRRVDPVGKQGPRMCPTGQASAIVRAMFGGDERCRLG